LPAIVDAVGNDIEVMFDGGVRSGQDVLKACAVGARGVMIGRAFLYALGAMGQEGVTTMLNVMRKELDVSMALTGTKNIQDVGRHLLVDPRKLGA